MSGGWAAKSKTHWQKKQNSEYFLHFHQFGRKPSSKIVAGLLLALSRKLRKSFAHLNFYRKSTPTLVGTCFVERERPKGNCSHFQLWRGGENWRQPQQWCCERCFDSPGVQRLMCFVPLAMFKPSKILKLKYSEKRSILFLSLFLLFEKAKGKKGRESFNHNSPC